MPFRLSLTLEYDNDTHWRWVLSDASGRFLADQEVSLDSKDALYPGFVDLPRHLEYNKGIRPHEDVLAELGAWVGTKVFGAVGAKLLAYQQSPACVVQVRMPAAAQNLLFRPFELAYLDGKTLVERGFRFVYTVARQEQAPGHAAPKDTAQSESLRILGVFSLPRDASPLNLRQERRRLQELVNIFIQQHGKAVELRLLQYGATRQLLEDVLQDAPGWDLIHFSGHGQEGELILEKPDGRMDRIDAEELVELLRPAAARLKLITLSACFSGAGDVRAARAQIGLANPSGHATALAQTGSALPSLGQRLAEELDCAVLAMRYPVLDDFAADLTQTLYKTMLEKKQPLPQALQLALAEALQPKRDPYRPSFSRLTPLLFGAPAADLRLQAPPKSVDFHPRSTSWYYFPNPPERFVGRLMPMLRASQALAPESEKAGVLFYGMAGGGKTACALELAYRYDPQYLERFTNFVWHKAPDEGSDIAGALTRLAQDLEKQLPGLELVGLVDDPQDFRDTALPRLCALLQRNAILIVLDNLEGLLTTDGKWRDSRWGELLDALLERCGLSRLVFTSRRLPAALAHHLRLQAEAVHALSFPESVLLARQLPHLSVLFKDDPGLKRLQRILGAAQGHPKLLELADSLAADPAALEAQLASAENASTDSLAFFERGESSRAEDDFVSELRRWTEGVAGTLGPTARLLAQFLARLEDEDRTQAVVEDNWEDFLRRLVGERGVDTGEGSQRQPVPEPALSQARSALGEAGLGLQAALEQLAQSGLVEVVAVASPGQITPEDLPALLPILASENPQVAGQLDDPQALLATVQAAVENPSPVVQAWLGARQAENTWQQYRLHPGVAEALLRACPPSVREAADTELGDYFIAVYQHGLKTETQGGGRLVVEGARRAAPYLMRLQRWGEAAAVLERMVHRDTSPATLALALPLLRRITEQTRGAQRELVDLGVLANVLVASGRYAEAEAILRDLIARGAAQAEYRLASAVSGDLLNLLRETGRYEEALRVAEEKAGYTRRAGLGPWTQLGDECRRLQILVALGRYAEVLAAVEPLRVQMTDLPEESEEDESANPWNVRETLLDTGREAALRSSQWETALALNAEILEYKRRRGADEMEIARMRFNDYGPLLRLKRYTAVRSLLEDCRQVFERVGEIIMLGKVYTALADLEDKEDHADTAVSFEHSALRYAYQAGLPEDCANRHNNLANYLEGCGATPQTVLAHGLAAGIIRLQTGSGQLADSLRNLSRSSLPPTPPSFAQACAIVGQVGGVRLQELFARLPPRLPDGDAAIQKLWELALEQRQRVLGQFEPLLKGVAAVAQGDDSPRAEIEARLPELDKKGWHIASAVQRIWGGERDPAALTAGLDELNTALVQRVLELLVTPA